MTESFLPRASGASLLALAGFATGVAADPARWEAEVAATERAFARSMAERDHAAFSALLSEQAVFFTTPDAPLRGKAAVAAYWRRWFDGPQAPFSWEPDQVTVLADGTLAHSTGPVRDPAGAVVGRFHSTWRQEAPGVWRIVFDRGEAVAKP
jgi:ketosteroid isomerase-like protein